MAAKVVRISSKPDYAQYWRLCWEYRELLWFLARRDFVVKYRQTVAGILWLLFRPAVQVFTFTVLFGVLAGFKSHGLPYPMLVMSGVVVWQFFSCVAEQSTGSLVGNMNLVTKVSFPRILLPIGTIAPNLVDLGINLLGLLALMAYFHFIHPTTEGWLLPSWRIVFLPLPLLMASLVAVGFGFFFSAACVKYRDFRRLQPVLLRFLHLMSPVGYTSAVIHEKFSPFWRKVYYCNPLAVCIDFFRWCVLPYGEESRPEPSRLLISLGAGLLIFVLGQWYFRRQESTFADAV